MKWLFPFMWLLDGAWVFYNMNLKERCFCVCVAFAISGHRFESGYLCVIFLSSETLTSTRPVLQAQDIYPSMKTEEAFSTFCQIDCQDQGEIVFQVCPCSAVSKFSLTWKQENTLRSSPRWLIFCPLYPKLNLMSEFWGEGLLCGSLSAWGDYLDYKILMKEALYQELINC